MESAADALQMAAMFLIFIIALTISINAFGEVRQTSQLILNYSDREYDYSYVLQNDSTERTVGIETIIPSIYKAYKENYKILFDFGNDSNYLYIRQNGTKVFYIDLEKEVLGNNEEKEMFIRALLKGKAEDKQKFEKLGIQFNAQTLYSMIENKKFQESLGIYYQEELQGQLQGGNIPDDVPDANKTKKRVITYKLING